MKKIIVPTDFSQPALTALRYGAELAQEHKIELLIVHAYEMPHSSAASLVSIRDKMRQDAELGLFKLKKQITDEGLDTMVKIDMVAVYGSLLEALETVCGKYEDQLIVMGTVGKTGILSKVLGSNTSGIIKKLVAPVLAVPPTALYKPNHKMLVAADLAHIPLPQNVEWITKILVEERDNELELVHIVHPEDSNLPNEEAMERLFSNFPTHTNHLIKGEDVADELDKYVGRSGADIVVLTRHKRNFLQELFHESITKQMALFGDVAILVLKDQ